MPPESCGAPWRIPQPPPERAALILSPPSLPAGSRSSEKRLPFSLRKSHSALKAAPTHPPASLAQVVYLKDIVCYLSLLERGRAEDKLECKRDPGVTGCQLLGELGGTGGNWLLEEVQGPDTLRPPLPSPLPQARLWQR